MFATTIIPVAGPLLSTAAAIWTAGLIALAALLAWVPTDRPLPRLPSKWLGSVGLAVALAAIVIEIDPDHAWACVLFWILC